MTSGSSTDHAEPDVRAAALAAAARTRAQGMHYYGHVLGVTPLRTDAGPSRPHLAVSSAVTPGPVPPVALATVADLAMGSAIRSVVGAGRRLGTVSMTLHHLAPVVRAPVVPDPRMVWLDDEQVNGLARVDLTDAAGALVGAAQGWFMALPAPSGTALPLLPWERDELPAVAPLAEHDLTAAERAAVEATVRAAERAHRHRTSASAELTAPTWTDAAEGSARGALRIGPEITNRVGHVQGGAVYGIALAAATRAVGAGLEPAEGHVQFLRPADGDVLTAVASTTRLGRGAAFAEATLTVGDRPVAAGRFAFRPAR
jgi:acyl-coenzyme A thioesterase PaaI-like protein